MGVVNTGHLVNRFQTLSECQTIHGGGGGEKEEREGKKRGRGGKRGREGETDGGRVGETPMVGRKYMYSHL